MISKKQQKVLRSSPYVEEVGSNHIQFTQEFRDLFQERVANGDTPSDIFFSSGILLDPKEIDSYTRRYVTAPVASESSGVRIYFTDKEMETLKKSGCIADIRPYKVVYTGAFKQEFLDTYRTGIPVIDFFEDHGLPVSILGKSRIWSFSSKVRKEAGLTGHVLFSRREVEQIKKLKYVTSVTSNSIRFKKKFSAELSAWLRDGKGADAFFLSQGFPVTDSRVQEIVRY